MFPRHRTRRAILALALLLALSAGLGLGLSGGDAPPTRARQAASDGELRVERRAPDDGDAEVATDAVVLVQFSASVQPLTALADTPNRPVLRIDPPVEGTGTWLTSAMYRFRPAQGWSPSSRYTVSIAEGLTGLDGEAMSGAVSWSFSTIAPAVADVTPGPNTNQAPAAPVPGKPGEPPRCPDGRPAPACGLPPGPNLNQASATGVVTVRFNQPVDRAAAERALSFDPPITGAFSWPDDATLVLRPDAPLNHGATYTGTVAAGIPAANGAAASASPFTWSFTTAGAPAVTGSEPRQGDQAAQSGSIVLIFATPMDRKSVEERVTLEPKPADGPFMFWEPDETKLHVNFPGRPSTDYRLTLAPGATDRFGQVIEGGHELSFRTRPLPPSLTLSGGGRGGAFLAGGETRAVLSTTNLSRAELTLYRIEQAQFAQMLTFGKNITGPPQGAAELRRWRPAIAAAPENRAQITVLDLNAEGQLDHGFYLLWATGEGRNSGPQYLPFTVTGTHVTLKRSATELLVWALDYASGAPVADVAFRAFSSSGTELGQGRTDAQGLASISVPAPDPRSGPDTVNVTGERAGDIVFASTAWAAGGGFPYSQGMIGSMTTERPIYRPGETVYYQGVLRVDDDAKLSVPPADPGATLIVQDSRGRELIRRSLRLDEYGSFDGDLALDAEAPSGGYFMRIEQGDARGSLVFHSFQVADFRRPEFAVTVKAERDDYDNGQQIGLTASAELFLGAPLGDAAVRWRVTASPLTFNPPDFPGYSFTDPDDRPRRLPLGARLEGTGRTDARGAFAFTVPADVSGDTTSQVLTVEATVTDADNQEVSSATRVRVHKAARYAGVRPRDYVGVEGRPVTVDLVTVDRDGRPAGGEALSVRIVQRRWTTVKVRDADGEERYESQPDDREVETRSVRSGADGKADLTFTPRAGGFYRVVASGRDAAGNEYHSAGGIYVTGAGYIPWLVTNDDRLELVADKKEYKPGDVAHVLVPAPFAGAAGLVTLERAGVISKEVRRFEGNGVVLDIPIERAYLPNIYLSVVLFRPPTGDNPVPEFRSGQIDLPVSAEEQRLAITLTPDKPKVGPRETVTFAVRTTNAAGAGVPAELSLALVDEAILSLTDDRPADAFRTLYGTKRLGVQTAATSAVSLDQVADRARALQQGEGKGGGGGGGEQDIRSDFRFTAHWEPALRTDAAGNGTLSVRMPDTLTSWRLTARGITLDSKAGLAETKVATSKPLIVRPVAPRFFTAGDRPELGAIVQNLTDTPLDVRVSLAGDGLTVEGDAARSVRVEPGGRGTMSWKAATPTGGEAKVRWTAAGGGVSDGVELTLPVYALATPEVVASSGAVKDRATEVVRGPGTPGARASDITLNLWPSLTAALPETVRYLREWPFESAELTASRLLTAVGVAKAQGRDPDAGDLGRWVQRLYATQHPDGGWGWWSADASDPAISAYAVMALAAVRDAGREVDSAVLGRAAGYLRGELDRTRDVRLELNPNTRALLVYALTTADGPEMPRAFALAERRSTLGPEGKALVALAMTDSASHPPVASSDPRLRALLNDLTSSATTSAAAAHWDDPVSEPSRLSTATRTTALALRVLARADADAPLVDDAVRWLMNERREGRWASTQESALAVLALGTVAEARGEGNAAYAYRVTLGDQTLREARVERAGDAPADSLVIKDGLHAGDNRLTLSRAPADAAGRLYYQLSYRYVTPAERIGALDQGLAVAREILPADGGDQPLTRVKAGDLVRVRVTVLASGTMNYVAVEDYLPAGLEAVDASLRTTSAEILERQRAEAERQAKLRGGACRIAWRSCFSPFTHTDIRADRVALFARELPKGAHEFVYFARATTPGTYLMRPSRAAEVYFPDVWGRTDSGVFVVE